MAEVKWPTIELAFKEDIPVIIPLGAGCKEHGYHLPMNTDLIIAEYLANWVMAHYQVLIAPTIQYSYFPAFSDYPGSATLSYETAVNFFVELCNTWYKQGAKRFYVLNTGLSTNAVLSQATNDLQRRGIDFSYFDFSMLYELEEIKRVSEQKRGSHADEIETSIILAIRPEVVDMAKACAEENPDKPGPLSRENREDRTVSFSGVWGNPTLATQEKGAIALELLKQLLSKDLERLCKLND
ncbi:Creatinine amidohydrolase [Legionella massiliensis]|uniref:Creatinine amidohydrolase n=1 Tax=Legionella massiliensis TaxID=1034943 RepID=A0A078KWF0_9GAMM|nr:creatininase family protein [Legionella massiliensis]CDZ76079.1 Creatinine amidohydrolase [Legionella massiliensis]CEE11817.1 Creatinine amidohydrolase [Legionella massiliensis]